MNKKEQKKFCNLCNLKFNSDDEFFLIKDNFIKINSFYIPLVEIIRETIGFQDEFLANNNNISSFVCKECQELVTKFYNFKIKCKENQRVQSEFIKNDDDDDSNTLSDEYVDDQNDKILYSTVQIVRNYIEKYAVQTIQVDESAKQLIITAQKNSQQQVEVVSSSTNAFHDNITNNTSIKEEPFENLVEIKIEPLEIKEEGEADEILGINIDFNSHEESTNSSDNSLSKLPAFAHDRIFDGNRFISRSELILRKSKKDQLKKREKRPDSWASAIQKKLRNTGQSYRSVKGYVVAAKCLGPPCNCRKDCAQKVNESNRLLNFKEYWKLESEKKQFILDHIKLVPPKRALTKARAFSRIMHHYLSVSNYDGTTEQVKVCKKMFCQTLNISNSVITNVFKSKEQQYFEEMDK